MEASDTSDRIDRVCTCFFLADWFGTTVSSWKFGRVLARYVEFLLAGYMGLAELELVHTQR